MLEKLQAVGAAPAKHIGIAQICRNLGSSNVPCLTQLASTLEEADGAVEIPLAQVDLPECAGRIDDGKRLTHHIGEPQAFLRRRDALSELSALAKGKDQPRPRDDRWQPRLAEPLAEQIAPEQSDIFLEAFNRAVV